MRKIKEVLRLRFEVGLGQRQIARSCRMGLSTVLEYLERALAAGIGWPLPEGLGEEELEAKLFGKQVVQARAVPQRPQPDWKAIHEQLQQHRHLTLQLVWEEYRQSHPESYRYSWFCERYQQWRRHLDVVLRQEHKAGEKMFVDWAGSTIPVYDATTGQPWPASLFVSVLGASSYTYAEATRDQQLQAWIQAHIHTLEFFGGVPTLAVPDNTKTAVTRACRYDPDLNPTYQELAIDYHIAVDGNFYSVPYTLVQQIVEARCTLATVEIFQKGNRIASHVRCRGLNQIRTQNEHRPRSHQAHLEWQIVPNPCRASAVADQLAPPLHPDSAGCGLSPKPC
jgi:transposase